MPEPTIPPVDPDFIEEVKHLTEESYQVLRTVTALSSRVGKVMEQMDELQHGLGDDAVGQLRDLTEYPGLINVWFAVAGHASAAADEATGLPEPSWYRQLIEKRHARFEAVA
jgi:hypothetical protein